MTLKNQKLGGKGESPLCIGFNKEGVYDAADYCTVYTLVTNR